MLDSTEEFFKIGLICVSLRLCDVSPNKKEANCESNHQRKHCNGFIWPQVPKVIKMFREQGPGTNQASIAVCNENSIDLEHPPCLRHIDCRVKNDKLHFMLYFRSWDLWGGFPTNLGGLQLLKEYMAGEIGVKDGSIAAFSKGLHLYEHCWDLAKMVLRIPLE